MATTVRMVAAISGTRDGVDWPRPGGHVTLPDGEAAHLVESGCAVVAAGGAVSVADDVESAAAGPDGVEVATGAAPRKRAR